MTGEEATVAVIDALNESGIPYMMVGSFSTSFYGSVWLTEGVDIVVDATPQGIAGLAEKLGSQFQTDTRASSEATVTSKRLILHVVGTQCNIEFFRVGDAPHERERFSRRVQTVFSGRKTFLPTAEDVVVTELVWANRSERHKDLSDIASVIAARRDRLDWPYIEQWCDRHGTRALLEEIRQSLPPL